MRTSSTPSRSRITVKVTLTGLILLAAIGLCLWTGFGLFLAKSGYLYQKGIVRALNATYQSEFVIVSKEGLNEDGYQVFKASPANDRSLVFTVSRTNGNVDGGLPLRRQLSNNYEETAQKKYYPLLVKKYFGIELQDIPMSIYRGTRSSREISDENYVAVNRANLDEIASKAKAFFSEAESHRLKQLFLRFEDDLGVSSEDAGIAIQRLELPGFDFKVGEHWKKGFRLLSEEELKQKIVSQAGRGIADRVAYTFDTEYPDFSGNFAIKFTGNDLNSFEAYVSAHTITAEKREDALAEIYEAYTRVIMFIPKMPLNMTALHLKYETNTETESVTLKKEEISKVSSLAALKELFKHSQQTVNPR
ncbi:hypothetical protein P40081_01295 [Paenibacillus sp. FSL P4-0081]|nr:hypothetical protein P40081_01295 [Paenibacillus sp. FSL P4-0081]